MAEVDMRGKVCIVTGANSGVGLGTARGLAATGATVVMACRDLERSKDALANVESKSRVGDVRLMQLDLGSRRSIESFVEAFRGEFDRLDALVNNAAVAPTTREVTADGFEMQFGVNHLGHFVLTNLLLDELKANGAGRVVNVSSMFHRDVEMDFDDLESERSYSWRRVYSRSKLANVLFSNELARRLEGSGVTSNSLHPGMVRSAIMRDFRGVVGVLMRYGKYVLTSPDRGARTSVYLASSPKVEGVTGKYFEKCREVAPGEASLRAADAGRLWEVSLGLTGVGG